MEIQDLPSYLYPRWMTDRQGTAEATTDPETEERENDLVFGSYNAAFGAALEWDEHRASSAEKQAQHQIAEDLHRRPESLSLEPAVELRSPCDNFSLRFVLLVLILLSSSF